jgi:hypothetical protein
MRGASERWCAPGFMARSFDLRAKITDLERPSRIAFAATGQDVEIVGDVAFTQVPVAAPQGRKQRHPRSESDKLTVPWAARRPHPRLRMVSGFGTA